MQFDVVERRESSSSNSYEEKPQSSSAPLQSSSKSPLQHALASDVVEALPVGRSTEAQRRRQAVYLGLKTEGFHADEAPGDLLPSSSSAAFAPAAGTVVKMLLSHNTFRHNFDDCTFADLPRPTLASNFVEAWRLCSDPTNAPLSIRAQAATGTPSPMAPSSPVSLKQSGGVFLTADGCPGSSNAGGRSPAATAFTKSPNINATLGSSFAQQLANYQLDQALKLNCLDENQVAETQDLWWVQSRKLYTHDALQDVPPDMFMEICYPQQGFYVKMSAANNETYHWNERFQAAFNIAETPERRVLLADFVRDFSAEAVPFAMEVIANIHLLKSPVVHRNGITIEISSLIPSIKLMFDADGAGFLRSQKVVNREYVGRRFALAAACPQLNVPFSLMVEYIGIKVLVYPRMPLKHHGFPPAAPVSFALQRIQRPEQDELVLGTHHPHWLHSEPIQLRDSEVNAVVQRLGLLMKCKGAWLGKEFKEKVFVYGSLDMQVFRSSLDNRIYAKNLRRMTPCNILNHDSSLDDGSRDDSDGVESVETRVSRLQQPNDYFLHVFRPEFVQKFQKFDVSCESASPIAKINVEKDEAERLQNVDLLLHYIIPQAAEQLSRDTRLNNVTWPFFAGGGMSHFLHSWGINMRHLVLVHHKLLRTKLSGTALMYVEIEMLARALKQWVVEASRNRLSGELRDCDLTEHLLMLLPPFTSGTWDTIVWKSVAKKYPVLSSSNSQAWDAGRVDHSKVIQRLFRILGVTPVLQDTEQPVEGFSWLQSIQTADDAAALIRLQYYPIVQCPGYPRAPLEEGQDVHLMILAKRYLREVTYDLKFNPVSNREMLDRYVAFLEQMGERNCEEILGFYIAEQERKDRVLKGSKPAVYAEAGKDEKTIRYRLRDNRGMRTLDISRETMDTFKFYNGQKVQQTLGGEAGRVSTIIGVLDGVLFHHEERADGAVELFGHNYNELQANYGFVLLDKLLSIRRFQLQSLAAAHGGAASAASQQTVAAADVCIQRPFHLQVSDRGLLIFETSAHILLETFGVEFGQRLMYIEGPKKGSVTTVIGCLDGTLWHQFDGALQCEVIRPPADFVVHMLRTGQHYPSFRDDEAVTLARTTPKYPIDAATVYDPSLDIFAGYRSCVQLGFFYRQVVVLQKGPYQGERGVILGAKAGEMHVLLPFHPLPLGLGYTASEIVDSHAPQVVGTLSYDPVCEPPRRIISYSALGGECIAVDVSFSSTLALGSVAGQRIKVVLGHLAGLCGFVVGALKGKLWVQLDGEPGAQPLSRDCWIPLRGSVFDVDEVTTVPAEWVSESYIRSVFPSRHPSGRLCCEDVCDVTFMFLADWGEVVAFDASPVACDLFGLYHSQRVRIQRHPRRAHDQAFSADVMYVSIVGVFHGELFFVEEGTATARPFAARTRWHIECIYAPEVVGIAPLAPWHDIFCGNAQAIQVTSTDAFYEDKRVLLAYCTSSETLVGLDTTKVSSVHPAWTHGTTIIRQDRIVSEVGPDHRVHHRPEGPQATVLGVYQDTVYIELRSSYSSSVGRANMSSALRKVKPLDSHEFPRWLVCAGWANVTRKTFLSPEEIKKSDKYDVRIGLQAPPSPVFSQWWGYLDLETESGTDNGASLLSRIDSSQSAAETSQRAVAADNSLKRPKFILFERSVSQCLERLFEKSGGKSGSHYDVDGGSYFIESMTYKITNSETEVETVYEMVREPLQSVDSYCQYAHRLYLAEQFPDLHSSLSMRMAARVRDAFGSSPRIVTQRRQSTIVFAREELPILHDVCSVAPKMVLVELERRATHFTDVSLREIELRYASVPKQLKLHVVSWVLRLLGVPVEANSRGLRDNLGLLLAMEHASGRVTDVPTMDEYVSHLDMEIEMVIEDELFVRRAIVQEEANRFAHHMPTFRHPSRKKRRTAASSVANVVPLPALPHGTNEVEALEPYDNMSLRVMRSCLSVARHKFTALMEHKTPINVQVALQLPMMHRLTLEDGTTILMEPSCMPWIRGDVIEYTVGDIAGVRATVLGMHCGNLWRCEHTGSYKMRALPFAGTEADIRERYHPVVIRREDTSRVRLHEAAALSHHESNVIRSLCFDGVIRDINPSYAALSPYGVAAGDRLCTTFRTNLEEFPFSNLTIAIFGVSGGRLWFAVDQTGLLPFPEDCSGSDVLERFGLRRVCNGPLRQPSYDASKIIACQGVVTPEEGAVVGRFGPMTLCFVIAPEIMGTTPSGTKMMLQSGDNRGRRFAVVGFRHGKLWVLWEHEMAARALRSPLSMIDCKALPPDTSGGFRSFESTTSLGAVPLLEAPPPVDEAWLRFPTQRGGLSLFSTNSYDLYKLHSGQEVTYAVARKHQFPQKKAIIVGVREGALWKVDEFDSEAKPFIGVSDLATLMKKFDITKGPIVGIESQTW